MGAKAKVADDLKQPEPVEGEAPPEPLPEQLKPYEEAVAGIHSLTHSLSTHSLTHYSLFTHSLLHLELGVWTNTLSADTCAYAVTSVQKHVLPVPRAVLTAFYVAGLIVGFDPAAGLEGTHSLTHSLTDSLTHSLTDSLTHSLTHSITHSLTHSLTHLLTHSLARSIN